MALTVVNNLTTADDAEAITGWSLRFGTLALLGLYTDDSYQSAGCIAHQTKNATTYTGVGYDLGAGGVDMSAAHYYVRATYKYSETPKLSLQSVGGISLFLEDTSGNIAQYYIGGSDTYAGAWEQALVDVGAMTPDRYESGTSITLTAIRYIGVAEHLIVKPAKAENAFQDIIYYGTDPSITVTGTVTTAGDGWSELEAIAQSSTNRYGVIRNRDGIYQMKGGVRFNLTGGAGSVDFSDNQNSKLSWAAPNAGNLDAASFISVEGNATGTTDFTLGSLVGTGDSRQGYIGGLIASQGPRVTFDSATDTANIDSMELYGVILENLGTIAVDGSTTQETITCTYLGCYQVDSGAAEVLACFFVSTADVDAALLWNESIDILNCQFIANTVGAAVEHPSAVGSPYTHTNLVYSGNTFDVLNSSGSAISISKTGTSNPTTSEGSAVTYIGASVTVQATATTTAGVGIENTLVLVKAVSMSPEGPFPVSESVTIARTGSPVDLAVVSHTGHGMQANDKVVIEGAAQAEYNGVKTITYIDANSYSFVCSSSPLPVTPATGTITATFAALYGLTDADGIISTSRVYNSPQDVSGWSRKMSGTPYYKEGVLTGTISTTTGFDRSAVMALDE